MVDGLVPDTAVDRQERDLIGGDTNGVRCVQCWAPNALVSEEGTNRHGRSVAVAVTRNNG
jgi:hypothetical protein